MIDANDNEISPERKKKLNMVWRVWFEKPYATYGGDTSRFVSDLATDFRFLMGEDLPDEVVMERYGKL